MQLYGLLTLGFQTMEVAVARVYNWDIVQKRKDQSQDEKGKGEDKEEDDPSGG